MFEEKIALFRFQCIQPLVDLARGQAEAHLVPLMGKPVEAPNGKTYKLSRATLLRWLSLFRQNGMEGLKPRSRSDRGTTKKITGELAQALLRLKKEKPQLTLDALIYQARINKILAPGQHLPRVSLYRFLKRHGLIKPDDRPSVDRLRFEAESPMDLVQADVMHGPKIKNKKVYLIALIDDHSRLILWAEFRFHETVEDFIAVLKQALLRRGLPRKIYVDNGSAFRANRLEYALASLGVSLIHSRPYQPEGKGKCERWFRTVRENFIPQLSLQDYENLQTLNNALFSWMDGYYHQTIHSSTGQTPLERFIQNLHATRPAPENLKNVFRHRVLRKVGKDRVVSLHGKAFEAPPGCIGKRLELRFDPDLPHEIEAFDNNLSVGFLKYVLVHSNAKIKRLQNEKIDLVSSPSSTKPSSGQVPFFSKTNEKGK